MHVTAQAKKNLHMAIVSRKVYLCRSNGTDAQVSQAKYESLYQGPKAGLAGARED